jgi:hypothetical protein
VTVPGEVEQRDLSLRPEQFVDMVFKVVAIDSVGGTSASEELAVEIYCPVPMTFQHGLNCVRIIDAAK